MLLFGPGYVGRHLADAFAAAGAVVMPVGRDTPGAEVRAGLAAATHVVSTAPPGADGDPILALWRDAIGAGERWLGYLSSTGVYGDTRGGWVDESCPRAGRRSERNTADAAWEALGARVFRLPGIYGPGRSMLDRVAAGQAQRLVMPMQVFSRIHVDDICGALLAAAERGPAGIYNIADDLPAPQNDVVAAACGLLGVPLPPVRDLEAAILSPAARAFYDENRRVANGKAKRLLGWRPRHADYRAGLRALMATTRPTITSAEPTAASSDQR